MELYEKDGITVQAQSDQEAASYLRLGFKKVVAEQPEKKMTAAEKKAAKDADSKDGE